MNGRALVLGTASLLAIAGVASRRRGSSARDPEFDREDAIKTLATNANLDAICTYAAILARPPSKLLHRAAAAKEKTRWAARLHTAFTNLPDEAAVLLDALRDRGVTDKVLLVVGDVDIESGVADVVKRSLGGAGGSTGWPTSWLDDAIESADAAIEAECLRLGRHHPLVQEALGLRSALAHALETGDDTGLADAATLAKQAEYGFGMDNPALAATHAAVLLHLSSSTQSAWFHAVRAAVPGYVPDRPQHDWIRAWRRLTLRVLVVRPDLASTIQRGTNTYRRELRLDAWAHGEEGSRALLAPIPVDSMVTISGDAVVEIRNAPPGFVGLDPEDGMEATVDAELRVAKILKLPAKLTLRAPLDRSHFRRFVQPKGSRARPDVALMGSRATGGDSIPGMEAYRKLPADPDGGSPLHTYGYIAESRVGPYWTIPVAVPVRDLRCLSSVVQDRNRLASVARARKQGVSLPPIEIGVFRDNTAWLMDGNHRLRVARDARLDTIEVRFTFVQAPSGSRARPDVALTPQVLTEPGHYFHPDARRFTWTPPPAHPATRGRPDPLHLAFKDVEEQDDDLSPTARDLSRRVAAQLAEGLHEVLPGVVPHLKSWTLQFTNKPSITAWTDPNRRQLRFGAHPLSAAMLLHEAVHVADSACYAGGGQDCLGNDAWASYDKRHPLGVFATTLRAAWKESGEDERLLDRKVRQAVSPLPLPIARALLRGEGVRVDAALEAISHQAGVPARPATLRDALERARSPFGGVDVPEFLALSGLPASASRAITAIASCLPVGVPFNITSERDLAVYRTTLTTKQIRRNTASYWMTRHELLARYVDQRARQELVARGRWVPHVAPGGLPEAVMDDLEPAGRTALREVGWTR